MDQDKTQNLVKKTSVPSQSEIYRVINSVVVGLWPDGNKILFVDEFKLPLHQTPAHYLTEDGYNYRINNKRENITIIGIAMCSSSKFKYVQLYIYKATSKDFIYFIQECTAKLPTNKAYSFILDDGIWQASELVRNTDLCKCLLQCTGSVSTGHELGIVFRGKKRF